ncbi:methionyl-tRNA formyltransferase [Sulfobacillus harzensis]|uniref:Methionyl-tRNA formyltransferase n=1 Tax=Sulfobacillus harzensis TaxID=2729629 RepID=A0A7Y0L328_9FIRM|nr:methionyl-tRNA formyltransferase [Sulfobacillus harzensis]NMP22403.1 methionyl-tRNA formyltransferase [Sulfobacillus harzensis]
MARILFMGTPEYARRILERIYQPDDQYLVVTKPDMPVGRRQILTPSPVAVWAEAQNLPVMKPVKLKDFRGAWESFKPDWILTAAYGRILPPWLLALPRVGAYNLHASLLPRWRGANPVAWAILSEDSVTGVTLMAMDEGMDTGPIVATATTAIGPEDTTGSLTLRLAELGAALWLETRDRYGVSRFPSIPQDEAGRCLAPKFDRTAGRMRWDETAHALDAQVRSMTPEPGAYTMLGDLRIKILAARAQGATGSGTPGTAHLDGEDWTVQTGEGILRVSRIQPAGRRIMSPGEFVRGRRGEVEWTLQ